MPAAISSNRDFSRLLPEELSGISRLRLKKRKDGERICSLFFYLVFL
jgi:hypothetical protein